MNPNKRELREAVQNGKNVQVKIESGAEYEFRIDTVDDALYLKKVDNDEPYIVLNGRLYERIEPPEFRDGVVVEANGDGIPVESIKIIHELGK